MSFSTRHVLAPLAWSLSLAAILASLRLIPELSLINSVRDAQNPIAILFSLIIAGFFLTLGSFLIYLTIQFKGLTRVLCGICLSLCFIYQVHQGLNSWTIKKALIEAANPLTPASRLVDLEKLSAKHSGYELDNRLASNPNSPEKLLRKLAEKDQIGTKMCLVQNPNTPDDIHGPLSKECNAWKQAWEEKNPKYRPKSKPWRPAYSNNSL